MVITSECGSEDLGSIPNRHLGSWNEVAPQPTKISPVKVPYLHSGANAVKVTDAYSAMTQKINIKRGIDKMKYYSELTKHLYETENELRMAENKVKEETAKREAAENLKKAERAKRAKEVENAIKEANAAQTKAIKLLKDFTNDYGYFHTTYSSKNMEEKEMNPFTNFFDVLDAFLKR
jgi:hypothetical protein